MTRPSLLLASLLSLGLACHRASPAASAADVTAPPVAPPAAPPAPTDDTTPRLVAAVQALLATLSDAQRAATIFPYDDAAQRTRWSNFPTMVVPRSGVRMGDLTPAQKDAVYRVLAVLLSPRGYRQVRDTVDADEALRLESHEPRAIFGAAEYYLSLRGTPSLTAPWAVQFGGHHLGINATIVGSHITLAPSLTGAQPASFVRAGVTVRPQGAELDAAFAFVNALTIAQRATAVVSPAYLDLALGPGHDGVVLTPEGLRASDLTAAQQTALLDLIGERVGLLNDEDAAARMAELRAHLAETYFAWAGPITPGSAAYYRITGPTLAIEYAPQRMGDAVNHTHAMYRDPTNDYGAAWALPSRAR